MTPPDTERPGGDPRVPEWFRRVLDTMLDLVSIQEAVRDDEGNIVDFQIAYANRAAVDVAGRRMSEHTGTRLRELYPNIGPIVESYGHVVETGQSHLIEELPYQGKIDGRDVSGYYCLQVARFGDGVLVVSRDVTETVDNRRQIERTNLRLEAAQALAHIGIFTLDDASDTVWFSEELRRIFGLAPDATLPPRDEIVRTMFSSTQREVVDGAQRAVMQRGRPVVFETTITRPDGQTRCLLVHVERELRDGTPVGIWGTAQDITTLRTAEGRLDEAQLTLAAQRDLIDQFQAATLASLPTVPGIAIEAGYYPAIGASRLGGDWYDAFRIDEHTIGLAVGDIAGHGIAAVASMAQLRNVLRAYAYQGAAPGEVLAQIDDYVRHSGVRDMATALYGTLDLRTGTFRWAHAGHPPPVVVDATGNATIVAAKGQRPIGHFAPGPVDPAHELVLPRDGTLILYTDGLIERRGESVDTGLQRLADAAGTLAGRTAGSCRRLRDLCVDEEHPDDVCILTVRCAQPA